MKRIHWNRLTTSAALMLFLSFLLAAFSATQRGVYPEFWMGFPFSFFTVRVGAMQDFSAHLNLSSFAVNWLVAYGLCELVMFALSKRRG